MNRMDIHHDIETRNALSSATIGSSTTTYGEIIDTIGYEALEMIIKSGTITDGAYAVTLQEGDNSGLSDVASVSSEEQLGSADFAATDDNKAHRLGYIGKKRYVRLKIVSTGVTSGGVFSGVAVLGMPHHAPVAD